MSEKSLDLSIDRLYTVLQRKSFNEVDALVKEFAVIKFLGTVGSMDKYIKTRRNIIVECGWTESEYDRCWNDRRRNI